MKQVSHGRATFFDGPSDVAAEPQPLGNENRVASFPAGHRSAIGPDGTLHIFGRKTGTADSDVSAIKAAGTPPNLFGLDGWQNIGSLPAIKGVYRLHPEADGVFSIQRNDDDSKRTADTGQFQDQRIVAIQARNRAFWDRPARPGR